MWDQIKQVIDTIGGKFVIAEGGKPKYIVLAFEEFKKCIQPDFQSSFSQDQAVESPAQTVPVKQQILKKGEGELQDTPESIAQKIADLSREEEEAHKIKIEDLPF